MERQARRGGYAQGKPLPATVPRTLNALSGILNRRRFAKVTTGDHSGSGSSKVVLYCVYSVR